MINPPQTLQQLQSLLLQTLESFSAISTILLLPCQEGTASQPTLGLNLETMILSNHTMVSQVFYLNRKLQNGFSRNNFQKRKINEY